MKRVLSICLVVFIGIFYAKANTDTVFITNLSKNYDAKHAVLSNMDMQKFDYAVLKSYTKLESVSVFYCQKLDIVKFLNNLQGQTTLKNLSLVGVNLSVIPNSIGKFKSLERLSLRANQLRTMPDSLIALQNLRTLDVSANGYLYDSEVFKVLKGMSVETLDFSSSGLFGIEPSIGDVVSLKYLDFSKNDIKELPATFESLKIHSLDMSENLKIDSVKFFDQLKSQTELKELYLARCELSILPSSIGSLNTLEVLNLQGNQIGSLPFSIGNLKKLKTLDLGMEGIGLRMNQISSLPISFSNLASLERLDLSGNKLTSIPQDFGQLNNLKYLDLNFNALEDFPTSIVKLIKLTYLNLNGNSIINLPTNLGDLNQLEELRLDNNFFNRFNKKIKIIPASIGNIKSLRVLTLRDNVVEELPTSIGSLTNLVYLDMRDNLLATLPVEICALKKLQYLDLKANELVTLPVCMKELTAIQDLNLSFNLSLKIGDVLEIANPLSRLRFMDVSYNNYKKEYLTDFLRQHPNCKVVNFNKKGTESEKPKRKEEMYKFEVPVDRK